MADLSIQHTTTTERLPAEHAAVTVRRRSAQAADVVDRTERPQAPDSVAAPRTVERIEALKVSVEAALKKLGDRVWDEVMDNEPMWATMEGYQRSKTDATLENLTPSRWRQHFKEIDNARRTFETKIEPRLRELRDAGGSLDMPAQLLADALLSIFDDKKVQQDMKPHLWSIITVWDLQTTLAEIGSSYHTISGEGPDALKQADGLKRRYFQVDNLFEQKIKQFREGAKQGLIAPPEVLEELIRQVGSLTSEKLDESTFLGTTRAWLAEVRKNHHGHVPREIRDAADEVKAAVHTFVTPSLEKYRVYLEQELLPLAKAERADRPGVGHLPRGEEYYATQLKKFAGTTLSFTELAALGERGIGAVMSARLAAATTLLGRPITEAELPAATKGIEALPENQLPEGDARLKLAQDLVDRSLKTFATVTGIQPLPMVVDFAKGNGGAQYIKAPADLSGPARMQIGKTGGDYASFVATIAHEVWHHLQFSAMQGGGSGTSMHPLAVAFSFTAAVEGGALFSEDLAGAAGLYHFEGDPKRSALAAFGATSNQLLRAWRIRVDLNLHAPSLDPAGKGWTIEQAVADGVKTLGWADADVRDEVLRYASWPAQATSYMIGKLELRQRKQRTKEELGDRSEGITFANAQLERDYNDLNLLASGALFTPTYDALLEDFVAKHRNSR